MERLRLIQAGVGGFGKSWALYHSSRSEDFELVAIADISEEALHEAGDAIAMPSERRFASLQAALSAVPADAVLTVTPPAVHLEHAEITFARGLHLMTEKPIADTLENARRMVEMAERAGRQLVVSQNFRWNPAMSTLRRLVREKALGELGHGHIDYYFPADFTGSFREKMRHVLLVDMAIHHLDLVRAITGRNIVKVFAQTFRPPWAWYENNCGLKMVMELEGGIPFSYSGDWSARGRNTDWSADWRLQCEEGSLHYDTERLEQVTLCRSSRGFANDPKEQVIPADTLPLTGQAATLKAFARAIQANQSAEISGQDNLWSFAAVMAGVESAETGRRVEVRAR